jgi:hypothetical protein
MTKKKAMVVVNETSNCWELVKDTQYFVDKHYFANGETLYDLTKCVDTNQQRFGLPTIFFHIKE